MLVGRDDILKELQDDLLAQRTSASRQHWLIRGPRGMGKTHLVAILYHRIHRVPELSSSFLPVWLSEEEAYDAYSAGMLLLAIANRLLEELEKAGDAGAPAFRGALSEIRNAGDDPGLFHEVCGLLKEAACGRGKILVVLMENLDAWLANMSGEKGRMEAGRLRSLLSDDKEFLFISTTPTRYLAKLSTPGSPLFGHLRERKLQPMSEDDIRELFGRLNQLTGAEMPLAGDQERPEHRLRWRVLHRLAGGNPRAVVMAYSVLSGASGIAAMVDELERMLDAQTAYYEARLEKLAPRERAILKALAMSSENLTISEMARVSRLPERSLSTQVKRLLDEGHMAPAGDRQGKGSVFELADGLFRTWFHYRSGRRTLEPLVRFLALWHTSTELESTLASLTLKSVPGRLLLERDLMEATAIQIQSALKYARSPEGVAEREQLWVACEKGPGPSHEAPPSAELVEARRALTAALEQLDAGEILESIASLRAFIVRFDESSEPTLQELAGGAMVNLGIALGRVGRTEEAIATCREAIARFSNEPAQQGPVARATVGLGIALSQAGRSEEAITTYRDVIARFVDNKQPDLQELVAWAMYNLGFAQEQVGRREDAIAAYRETIERFDNRQQPTLQKPTAWAMVNLGLALRQAGQIEEAIAIDRGVVVRFGESKEAALQEQAARAMVNLAGALGQAGRIEEAIATDREVIARLADSKQPDLQEQAARAMFHLGVTLGRASRREDEIATYHEAIARFGESTQLALQEPVARAMVNLGVALGEAGRIEEAIVTNRQTIARFGESKQPVLQEQAAAAMVNLGVALGQAGLIEEAIATYREAIARFGDSRRPDMQETTATAMFNLGVALGPTSEGAVAAYREVIARFGESKPPAIQEAVAVAMVNLGFALEKSGVIEEGIATYREVIARFGDSNQPAMQDMVATAMANLGLALGQVGRIEEEIATYRDAIIRFGESNRTVVRDQVTRAMFELAILLFAQEHYPEALRVAEQVIDRGKSPSESTGLEMSVQARLIVAGSEYAMKHSTEGTRALMEALRQLRTVHNWSSTLLNMVLRPAFAFSPFSALHDILSEIARRPEPEVNEMARHYGFVLELLEAEEPAKGKAKVRLAERRQRVLERVPPELRETVIEKAKFIREMRKGETTVED
ncbi:MAG TPA: tetratricopeptide repeat protein [Bryobacteraceae bacterium]|nr:tetratricopeptide repeat protein [Bryobacteraceae bacterium]